MADGPTPHIEATRGDYAPTVLLPGDPKRARFIADTYLDDVRHVNSVRSADGFTGTYEGRPVSVQAVGMGVPSALIYYTELIRFYGCENLIRVGSCGALLDEVELGDVIAATGAGTDSAAIATLNGGLDLPAVADFDLLRGAVEAAEAADIAMKVGPVFTSDVFYSPDMSDFEKLAARGILGVEMEIAALYTIASVEGVRALGLLTVSDHIARSQSLTSKEREDTFHEMVKVALAVS